MGLRFRKSIKIAPGVKLNLNKKSASVTLGGKGVHYTVNSKGKRTASVGIPGTGLSYSKSSGGTKKMKSSGNSSTQPKQTIPQNTPETGGGKKNKWWVWVIVGVFAIGIIGSPAEDTTNSVPETATSIETVAETTIDSTTATNAETETSTEAIAETVSEIEVYSEVAVTTETAASTESAPIPSSDPIPTPAAQSTSPASEQPTPITDESTVSTPFPAAPESTDTIVYITDTGKKYHRQGCRHLKKSCIEISLDQAVLEYEPCGVCNPPTK